MKNILKPLFLLADSEILFWKREDKFLLEPTIDLFKNKELSAAYIGASNKDQPAFYDIFHYAMEIVGITSCRMITYNFTAADKKFLRKTNLILLAGGDVKTGWEIFQKTGLDKEIVNRYYDGAILIGISAGAIQMGLFGWDRSSTKDSSIFETLKIVPMVIDVHDETQNWTHLKKVLKDIPQALTGIGIPLRGGMIYHPDQTIEAVRKPLAEFSLIDGQLSENLILPHVDNDKL